MGNEPNPYDAPESNSGMETGGEATFGQAVARGFSVANRTLIGAVLAFVILGPIQISSSISAALMFQGNPFQPPAEGADPPPELLAMMGVGCFICVWFPVLIFAFPYVIGGIAGQIRDRVFGREVGPFSTHGKHYYGRILCVLLLYIGVLMILFLPFWIAGAIYGAQQAQLETFDPEKLRELNRSPVNLAMGVGFAFLLTILGTILSLIQANLVVEDASVTDAISGGLRFVGQRFADTCKLFLVYLVLSVPTFLLQQAGNFLPEVNLAVMGVLGLVLTAYLSYLSVVNSGLVISVYAARRPTAGAAA